MACGPIIGGRRWGRDWFDCIADWMFMSEPHPVHEEETDIGLWSNWNQIVNDGEDFKRSKAVKCYTKPVEQQDGGFVSSLRRSTICFWRGRFEHSGRPVFHLRRWKRTKHMAFRTSSRLEAVGPLLHGFRASGTKPAIDHSSLRRFRRDKCVTIMRSVSEHTVSDSGRTCVWIFLWFVCRPA